MKTIGPNCPPEICTVPFVTETTTFHVIVLLPSENAMVHEPPFAPAVTVVDAALAVPLGADLPARWRVVLSFQVGNLAHLCVEHQDRRRRVFMTLLLDEVA